MKNLPLTNTVEQVFARLMEQKQILAGEIVNAIAARHQNYLEGRLKRTPLETSTLRESLPPWRWKEKLLALFDPRKATLLHGRLAILGLAELAPALHHLLEENGYYTDLIFELQEFFAYLLADSGSKLEEIFLNLLHNRAKHLSVRTNLLNAGPRRTRGFLLYCEGGEPDQFSTIISRQSYNHCLIAEYTAEADGAWQTPLKEFTVNLYDAYQSTAFQHPHFSMPSSDKFIDWRENFSMHLDILKSLTTRHQDSAWFEDFLTFLEGNLGDEKHIGLRLILLVRIRRATANFITKLTNNPVFRTFFTKLPERFGLIFCALPPQQVKKSFEPPLYLVNCIQLKQGQTLANDLAGGEDKLDTQTEIEALTDILSLKKVKPPLTVGILGGWGSGKSFILHLIEKHLINIRSTPVTEESSNPYIGHPYIIHFDAWTYAKANLWASLMEKIFNDLNQQIGKEAVIARLLKENEEMREEALWKYLYLASPLELKLLDHPQAEILKALEFPEDTLWKVIREQKRGEFIKWKEHRNRIEDCRQNIANLRYKYEQEVEQQVEKNIIKAALLRAGDELIHNLGLNNDHLEEIQSWHVVHSRFIHFLRAFFKKYKAMTISGVVLIVLLALLGILFITSEKKSGSWVPFSTLATGLLTASVGILMKWRKIILKIKNLSTQIFNQKEEIEAGIREKLQLRMQTLAIGNRKQEDTQPAELKHRDSNLLQLYREEQKLENMQQHEMLLKERLGPVASFTNLADFVQQRIGEQEYMAHLGLMHQVKKDMEGLSNALLEGQLQGGHFTRGEPRIYLIIDDLDRCTPRRVVEVLEAVQLLVKTRLFVVFLAMDLRFITRALEVAYKEVLQSDGKPDGLDYIEKIIQIPFRVPEISRQGMENYLTIQMTPQPEEPEAGKQSPGAGTETSVLSASRATASAGAPPAESPGPEALTDVKKLNQAEVLQFTASEYRLLKEACLAAGCTPRTTKRLVNVFKICKLIWYRRGEGSGPGSNEKKAFLLLLALSAVFEKPMLYIFRQLESAYRRQAGSESLRDFILGKLPSPEDYAGPWANLTYCLKNEELFPGCVSLNDFSAENFRLLRIFSFVGENKDRN